MTTENLAQTEQPGAGSTDWAMIREEREDYNVSAPDETGPARLLALLATLQLTAVEERGLVVLKPDSPSHSTIALVSASELFAWDEKQDERIERRRVSRLSGTGDLFGKKVALWKQHYRWLSGPSAYLYVVDLDNWLDSTHNQSVALMLEQDDRVVRKFVCRPDELATLLANPFGPTYRGYDTPAFVVSRAVRLSFEPPVRDFNETVTHAFTPAGNGAQYLRLLRDHPDCERLTSIANTLVRRIMGADYRLQAGSDNVLLVRGGKHQSMPFAFLGNGERHGLAFCAFLAVHAGEASPDMWLGVSESLNYLDLSRFLLALDALRDFVIATGANVYFRTDRTDYQQLARGKLEAAVKHIQACRYK